MDTRTIYLLTPETIFCSDPSASNFTYLDVSEFDNLNPTRGTIVSGSAGAVSTYAPYEATMTLTFEDRERRAQWIQDNSERVYQIAVANTRNNLRVYNKRCAITSFEFLENEFVNGVQTKLTLELFGRWTSTLTKLDLNTGNYEGGTKEFTTPLTSGIDSVSKWCYTYDSDLSYGTTVYTTAINLNGEHGFIMSSQPGLGLTLTLKSDYNGRTFQLESKWPDVITGLSTDFVAYPYTSVADPDRFTIPEGGTVATYGWNIEQNEFPFLYDMLNHADSFPIAVGAVNQTGNAVPIDVYAYTRQDFI